MKIIGKSFIAVAMLSASSATFAQACAEMEAEAGAISGVVPKFDEAGQLESVSMYADATFIVPKRSLIRTAREEAELRAKAALSQFFKEEVSRGTLVESLTEQVELTDGKGNTEAQVLEIKRAVDSMSSSTAAVISGIIKLDECVDIEQKYLLVRMGWKPSYIKEKAAEQSKVTESKGYRKKSSLADEF
ncbi:hypothetical protein IDSA_08895 [Pseudidiomarina salinarum]|uniref:Lipoprotein n=1 Tax=Pseudidiomarina salinarum TaxID=435908 RepID=A0A094IXS8_9GAMM|nr:hypothetical protein [Pseudidiomarina salinarum]KFZ30639.1 hypothetical protein IDSA_08895 [Pseudidiomarina salinarum]RUO69150.1 hypothetical protein CWI79_09585 [Pseudidiomarina salinarum]